MRTIARALALALAAWLCCSWSRNAAAHDPFEVTTDAEIRQDSLVLRITLALRSALPILAPGVAAPQPVSAETLTEQRTSLETAAAGMYEIATHGRKLRARRSRMELRADGDVGFEVIYEPPDPGPLTVRAAFLERLEDGYGNALTLTQALPRTSLGLRFLDRDNPVLSAQVLPKEKPAPAPSSGAEGARFGEFLVLGLEHLVAGYDHLLFLAALLLGARGFAGLLGVVTCFTLAHSITLALASCKLLVLPAALVEPLIAVSIVFAALDNLFRPAGSPARRYLVTTGFGLIHGFGFAGALAELAPEASILTTVARLLGFNLGIELGQLLIMALTLPPLSYLRSRPGHRLHVRVASIAIACAGAYWFVERTI